MPSPVYPVTGTRVALLGSRVPFLRRAADAPVVGETLVRADATPCATQVAASALVGVVGPNVLRSAHFVGGVRTVLVESSRTNKALRSDALDNASWALFRATVAANAVAGVDGSTGAEKLVEDATAGNTHFILPNLDIVVVTGARHVISVFARAAERAWFNIQDGQGVTANAYVNATTGALGGAGAAGSGAPTIAVETGFGPAQNFTRPELAFTAAGGVARIRLFLASGDGLAVYNGDGASGLFLTGAQCEQGAFATSYIPTAAAAVTRAVDVWTLPAVAISQPATLFYRYWDLATLAWVNAAARYDGSPIVPPVDRAYSHIAVLRGAYTAAGAAAVLRAA